MGDLSEKDLQSEQNNNVSLLRCRGSAAIWSWHSHIRIQILLEPFRYLCEHPGKDIRGRLIEAFDYYMKVPTDQLIVITKVTEMLHNASLL